MVIDGIDNHAVPDVPWMQLFCMAQAEDALWFFKPESKRHRLLSVVSMLDSLYAYQNFDPIYEIITQIMFIKWRNRI
jgi:hypothetical protein